MRSNLHAGTGPQPLQDVLEVRYGGKHFIHKVRVREVPVADVHPQVSALCNIHHNARAVALGRYFCLHPCIGKGRCDEGLGRDGVNLTDLPALEIALFDLLGPLREPAGEVGLDPLKFGLLLHG